MLKEKKYFIIVLLILLNTSCQDGFNFSKIESKSINISLKKHTKKDFKNWHLKDIVLDTIPGISLNRAYDSLLINKQGGKIIVAVIDMAIDIEHDDLNKHLWINTKEIPENNIDDDKNGYIDDINGWNFLGNKKGENNKFVNYEYTRILREFNSVFKDKNINDISFRDSIDYVIYKRAKGVHVKKTKYAKEDLGYINNILKWKKGAEKVIAKYLKKTNYNLKDLDSLKKNYPKNKQLLEEVLKKSNFEKYGYTDKFIDDYKLKAEERINKLLNLNYNDRDIQNDKPNDILDLDYGNNNVSNNIALFDHGTQMAGAIVNIAKKNEIEIMSLPVSAYGDEYNKDIALAIRYAVNNGAKVINMSFYKFFSFRKQWVDEAFKYAQDNNVIIINCAGNEAENLNLETNNSFPNDRGYFSTQEVSKNFIKVGASNSILDQNFRSKTSSYGNIDVDLFAPGKNIFTTFPNNKHTSFSGGTSLSSAITSGVAALLFSYYPNLTSSEVKHILMDSGLEFELEVSTPTKDNKDKMTPFNQLSKSGKLLNAYNALIMADSISKK